MKKINLSHKLYETDFSKPIYDQKEYWDAIHNILGKRDNNNEIQNFRINENASAFIDGGDTLQRIGMYYTGLRLLEKNGYDVSNFHNYNSDEQERIMNKLYCSWTWGLYRRHPEPTMWYSDEHRGSRDNTKPVVSTESLSKSASSIKRLGLYILRHTLFRGLLFDAKTKQNGASIKCHDKGYCDYSFKFPTLTGPTVWASYIRFAISKNRLFYILYPLLLVFDIEILLNSIIKQVWKVQYKSINKEDFDNDVGNHILYSCWFNSIAPTPIIWFMNNFVNSRNHYKKYLKDYYDDGRNPWTIWLIYDKLMDRYFVREESKIIQGSRKAVEFIRNKWR